MKTILVVDDDPGIVKLLESRLKANDYAVLTATEAADGLELAMGSNPDLIVLDVMMPIINGYNFCRLLKSQEKQKSIPVIFLTSRDAADDIKIGKDMGAEAYLTKPVNMDALLNTIRDLIKK
jgi:DNA-binding response OmpR family regulator